jgi:alcohol dehydrogenase class IV
VDVAAAMGTGTGLMNPYAAADAAIATVRALCGKAGLPTSLREIGVQLRQIDDIARNALDDAYIVTNPRPVREEDARAICQAAW